MPASANGQAQTRRLVECRECGLRHGLDVLPRRAIARCQRCGALLRAHTSLEACLALAIAGLVLILLANFMPFMSLGMEGRVQDASLSSGALALWADGLWPLGLLILLLTIVIPTLKLGAIAWVLAALKERDPPRAIVAVLRRLDQLSPWAMVEVYMLGLFVAYVKLVALATITVGVAVYALAALMVVMAAIDTLIDYDSVWDEVERKGLVPPVSQASGAALILCDSCNLLAPARGPRARCPRCDARLHRRKPDSVARCWALVLAAAVLYVPANVYPIMTVISFGSGAPDTIVSGVKHLLESGMWPLALLVFFASITVPVLKILGLSLLLLLTQRGSRWHLRERTRLYRFIEAVGRWSMIDIFMLSILVALVRLGAVASISPGVGALSFAGVVILTMFAAMAFDPRLMWDGAGESMSVEPAPAAPEMHTRWRISPVWAIPIVALGVALWLGYTTLTARGPDITITFRTGEGLEAGKTRVKHNDVELGTVTKIELSPDLSQVIATASMSKTATTHLKSGTRFWVVRPRLSLSNFSGLETLVSGSYIEMDPGAGDPARTFVGLEEPPVITSDVPGREFILTSERLGSIGPGTTIYFRSVKVGQVLGYDISPNGGEIRIHAFVDAPYDKLVYDGSRFWNDSGVSVRAGPQGFKLELESLAAVLTGAVGFDTPDVIRTGAPSKAGQVFPLFEDHEAVLEASFEQRVPLIVEFESSVHGLEVGAPVEFRGIKVGNVTDIELNYDRVTRQAHIPVTIEFELQRVVRSGPLPPGVSQSALVAAAMSDLVAHGLRAQLRTASFLTGQQVVAFDFFPDAPPAQISKSGDTLVLPSVPADIESLEESATALLAHLNQLLERVNKMPIEDVLQQARDVMQAYKSLAETPEIRSSLRTLDKTLGDADTSLQALDGLLSSAQTGYGNDSQVRREISDLLRQLQDTAKSVKVLADYVEQHPESFIRGKGGQ